MKTSIIICTYNRSELLKDSVLAIQNQDYPSSNYEILVVDNNSTDDTRAVTELLAASSPVRTRYIFEKNQGLSFARNAGIQNASGEVLIFVDDDIAAESQWLNEMVRAFDNPIVAAAGGPIRPIWPFEKPEWLTSKWHGFLTINEFAGAAKTGEFKGPYEYPWGANIAFRKEIFETVGMFPTDLGRIGKCLLSNEELGLCRKIEAAGRRIKFAPEAVIFHKIAPERISKQWYYHRTYWQGRSNAVMNVNDNAELYQRLTSYLDSLVKYELDSTFSEFDRKCMNRETLGYIYQLAVSQQNGNIASVFRSLKMLRISLKRIIRKAATHISPQPTINVIDGLLDSLKSENTQIQDRLDEMHAVIAAKDESIRQKEEQVAELLSSMSWKVTKPLRFIYGKMKRLTSPFLSLF